MRDSRLFQLLKKLDHKEFYQVRLFLESPFFQGGLSQLALFNDLVKFHPDYKDEKKLNKESILKRLYTENGGKGPNQLSQDRTKLTNLLETYFIYTELERQPFTQKKLLIDAYESRKMADSSREAIEKIKEALETQEAIGHEKHLLLNELNTRLFFHPETEKYKPNIQLLDEALLHLDIFYLLAQARIFAEQLHRKRLFNLPFESSRLKRFFQMTEAFYAPVIQLYRDLLKLLDDSDNFALYAPILQKLWHYVDSLPEHDQQSISAKLMYQANYYYERGNLQYLNTIFKLLELSIEKEYLTNQHALSHTLFVNYISVALNLGELEKAELFRKERAGNIVAKHKKVALALADAYILFYKGEYEAAYSLVENVSKSHAANRTQAETLFLRVCYELALVDDKDYEADYYEELSKGIEGFKRYIQDHPKLYSRHKSLALFTFMDLIEDMLKYSEINVLNHQARKKEKERISQKFKAAKAVYCGEWLSKKIEQL